MQSMRDAWRYAMRAPGGYHAPRRSPATMGALERRAFFVVWAVGHRCEFARRRWRETAGWGCVSSSLYVLVEFAGRRWPRLGGRVTGDACTTHTGPGAALALFLMPGHWALAMSWVGRHSVYVPVAFSPTRWWRGRLERRRRIEETAAMYAWRDGGL